MRSCFALLFTFGLMAVAAPAHAQRIVTYYAPVVAAPVTTYYAPVVSPPVTTYYAPAPVTTYYAPAATTVVATPVVAARPVIIRPKVYIPGQPVRNVLRAITP